VQAVAPQVGSAEQVLAQHWPPRHEPEPHCEPASQAAPPSSCGTQMSPLQ
jgi:hypothetical protein